MSYLLGIVIIAAIGWAIYRARESWLSVQDAPPIGPDAPDGKPTHPIDKL